MSQENLELVRAGFAAFEGDGDISAVLDLLDDGIVVYRADPDGATFHGKDGFLEATASWTEGFSEWAVAAQEFIDAGDFVIVRVQQAIRGEASGVPIESDFWFVFGVRESVITSLSFYVRESEAREAAGFA